MLFAATTTSSFAAEDLPKEALETNGLVTVLAVTTNLVHLGEPINVSLSVKNQGNREAKVEKSAAAFDCFEVIGSDGQPASYVGFMGQVGSSQVTLQPSSTVTIDDQLDLADKYLFEKPGRFSIRFRGAVSGVPASNLIMVDVAPGQLTELDQQVVRLLPVRPKGWSLTKSPRHQDEVAPFGRSSVAGYDAHICRNYMRGEAVYIWFTKAEAQPAPDQKPQLKSDYLGRTGGLYVYVAEDSKATALWPKAREDISRVLQIVRND